MNCGAEIVSLYKKQSAKRLIALAVCILFIAGSILSAAFIFAHIDHDHDHDGADGGCAVCVWISAAVNLLKSLFAAFVGAAVGMWRFFAMRSGLRAVRYYTGSLSLVCLKVRMNN